MPDQPITAAQSPYPATLWDTLLEIRECRRRLDRHMARRDEIDQEITREQSAMKRLQELGVGAAEAHATANGQTSLPTHYLGPDSSLWSHGYGRFREVPIQSSLEIRISQPEAIPDSPLVKSLVKFLDAPEPPTESKQVATFPASNNTVEAAEFSPSATQPPGAASRYLYRLTIDAAGEPRIRSTGTLVELVIGMRLAGMSCDGIVRAHPGLIIADVIACDDWYVGRGGRTEDFPDVTMKASSKAKDNGVHAEATA